ncbi:MAG: hypothetical protein KDH94_07885, partial [Coxiellaceae bacterium]|nr:hypothetical protein [Coxiellaceae bacterium]
MARENNENPFVTPEDHFTVTASSNPVPSSPGATSSSTNGTPQARWNAAKQAFLDKLDEIKDNHPGNDAVRLRTESIKDNFNDMLENSLSRLPFSLYKAQFLTLSDLYKKKLENTAIAAAAIDELHKLLMQAGQAAFDFAKDERNTEAAEEASQPRFRDCPKLRAESSDKPIDRTATTVGTFAPYGVATDGNISYKMYDDGFSFEYEYGQDLETATKMLIDLANTSNEPLELSGNTVEGLYQNLFLLVKSRMNNGVSISTSSLQQFRKAPLQFKWPIDKMSHAIKMHNVTDSLGLPMGGIRSGKDWDRKHAKLYTLQHMLQCRPSKTTIFQSSANPMSDAEFDAATVMNTRSNPKVSLQKTTPDKREEESTKLIIEISYSKDPQG